LNLIGISEDVCFYVSPAPGEAERLMIPATYPDNYIEVPSINSVLADMGIADKILEIVGWHPSPGGGAVKEPVSYTNSSFDNLTYLAGGYGYWVKVSEPGIWKIQGKPRLKALDGSKEVTLCPGWNLMADLFTKVHYSGDVPSAGFGSDAAGWSTETNMCDYLDNLLFVNGSQSPDAVDAMLAFDEAFPYLHAYYKEVPLFLQTLNYAGPGMGLQIKVSPVGPPGSSVTLEYPPENMGITSPSPSR
jgi:hypothetical protein